MIIALESNLLRLLLTSFLMWINRLDCPIYIRSMYFQLNFILGALKDQRINPLLNPKKALLQAGHEKLEIPLLKSHLLN